MPKNAKKTDSSVKNVSELWADNGKELLYLQSFCVLALMAFAPYWCDSLISRALRCF